MNNPWISGDIKPDKKGIYTRHIAGITRISKWDGKKWNDLFFKYPTDKKEFSKSLHQNLEWRNST